MPAIALTPAVKAALDTMTPAAIEFMTLVGRRKFDFFDDGIVEGSGNWGRHMAQQAATQMGKAPRSMGGIMARMAELELWVNEDQGADMSGNPSDTVWWTLTALGADVAQYLASSYDNPLPADEDEVIVADEAPKTPQVQTSHKDCTHPSTKAARAACRRARAKGEAPAPVEASEAPQELEGQDEAETYVTPEPTDAELGLETYDDLDADAYADAIMRDLGGQQ